MANTVTLSEGDPDKVAGLLQSYLQSGSINILLGSGASMPAMPIAGDIEAEIDTLLQSGDENAADLKTLGFLETLLSRQRNLASNNHDADVSKTLSWYIEFLAALDRILFERKNLLLPRQANIFSTNYDMFVETAAARLSTLILNDGFKRSPGISDQQFSPELYFDRTFRSGQVYSHLAELPTINLLKLHGSLYWRNKSSSLVFGAPAVLALTAEEKVSAEKVRVFLGNFFLVLPNLNKFNRALIDRTYYDLLRIFANALDRENSLLLCFGFSFRDQHILDITRRSLRNPTAQLLLIANDGAAASDLTAKFAAHRNVTLIAPADGKSICFPELNALLKLVLPN